MKFLCNREQLREALAVVNSVIPVKSTRPAIENVYIAASDEAVELVGTDLEVAVRYRLDEVKVEEPGTALIPARIAADFVRDLGGETATLKTKDDRCTITAGPDHCELVTQDPDEFPVVPRFVETGSIGIQAGNFSRLVNRTAFAAAREQGRYAMHGILTEISNDALKLVATDGRRLAMTDTPVDARGAGNRQAIVPTKGMQLFCRVMNDPLETVRLQFDDNQICLKTRQAEIFARLIDGDFPRYEAVIPASTENSVEADAETLMRKLRLVANVTSADTRAIRMSFKKDQLEITGRSTGCGEASAQMEADVRGKPGPIAFNPDYLIDGLKNCETDQVKLEFNEKTSPGKFRLGENYLYVVMPITVES